MRHDPPQQPKAQDGGVTVVVPPPPSTSSSRHKRPRLLLTTATSRTPPPLLLSSQCDDDTNDHNNDDDDKDEENEESRSNQKKNDKSDDDYDEDNDGNHSDTNNNNNKSSSPNREEKAEENIINEEKQHEAEQQLQQIVVVEDHNDHNNKENNDDNAATTALQKRAFWRRWYKRDRAPTIYLQRNYDVAEYIWNAEAVEQAVVVVNTAASDDAAAYYPKEAIDLVGDYDILFLQSVQHRHVAAYNPAYTLVNRSLARTVPYHREQLTIWSLVSGPNDDFYVRPDVPIVWADLQIVKSCRRRGIVGPGGREWAIQLDNIRFRQVPEGYYEPSQPTGTAGTSTIATTTTSGNVNIGTFALAKVEGGWINTWECEVRIRVLRRAGHFLWTPMENEVDEVEDNINNGPADSDDDVAATAAAMTTQDFMDYQHFMHDQAVRYVRGEMSDDYWWQPRHSWLVNHLSLPPTVAWHIQALGHHGGWPTNIATLCWSWQPGDLSIQLVGSDGTIESNYIVRRRTTDRPST